MEPIHYIIFINYITCSGICQVGFAVVGDGGICSIVWQVLVIIEHPRDD
jgi:hypothetical protein